MNKIRICLYMIKQGFQNIAKNAFMIFASISVIFVSLFIIGILYMVSANLQKTLLDLADKSQFQINCYVSVTEEQSLDIEKALVSDPRVESVIKKSKQENLDSMLTLFSDYKDLFEGYKVENMFVSFEVDIKDPSFATAFSEDSAKITGVESVSDTMKVVNLLTTFRSWIKVGTVISTVIMGLLSFLLVNNTINLTVMARKKELEIMKYVGASQAYICGPSVIEGVFAGSVGAVLAYIAAKGITQYASNSFIQLQIKYSLNFQITPTYLVVFLLIGIGLGVLGSIASIKRYIKET